VTRELRVLFVADDEVIARATTAFLATHAIEVHLVPRGDLAVADVNRIRPDVIAIDLAGDDRDDVVRKLRARTAAPIIAIVPRGSRSDVADEHVLKPFRPDDLLSRILAHR
jgi:DNA-binding response OmpR family regulator